jgi:hypothetical protein
MTCHLSARDVPLTKYLFQIIVGATSDARSGSMDVDQLLTTTRSARKALDLRRFGGRGVEVDSGSVNQTFVQ